MNLNTPYHTAMQLVENGTRHFGRFVSPPLANPLDEFSGLKRLFEDFRTKEWVGFTMVHPELYASMIMQNAKYLKTSEIYLHERASKKFNQHEGIGGGKGFKLNDDLMHASTQFEDKNYHIIYQFTDSAVTIKIDIAASSKAEAIKGVLVLNVPTCSHPLMVSARLPKGGHMYTNKIIYPASGYLQIGNRRYDFDPGRDMAILDEHKSHLPYHAVWTWGTFVFPADSNFVGGNFANRPQFPDQEEESGIWTPDRVEPLANISFDRLGEIDDSPWHIYSADGRLDVTFTPEGYKGANHNFVLAAIKYSQHFGTYKGTIRGENKTWTFEGIHGVCETMDMRA